jgi:hypothetical protein
MAFIGNNPSNVPLTGSQIADGTIVNANVATNTLNLTQKVTSTLPFANGGTGLSALGSANQVLAVNSGATALQYSTLSSDYVLLATTTASSSSAISFDGYFSSTYTNYRIIFSSVRPSTNQYFYIRARQSNADVTSSLYYGTGNYRVQYYNYPDYYTNLGSFNNNVLSGGSALTLWDITQNPGANTDFIIYNTTYNSINGSIDIFDPLSTNTWKQLHGKISYRATGNAGASNFGISYVDMVLLFQASTGSALSGFTFYPSTGTFTSGTFKLYGIK